VSSAVGRDDPRGLDQRASLLYELGCAFARRTELDELIPLVMAQCCSALDAESASVLLHDPETNELYFPFVADTALGANAALLKLRFPADRGIAGAVLQSGAPLRIDDVASDPRFYGGIDRRTQLVTRAMISAPLRGRTRTIGVIQVRNPIGGGPFSDADLAFLEALSGSVSVAIENARMFAQLREQVAALEQAVRTKNELLGIRRELDIARNIQQSILPRVFPPFPERTEFDLFAAMIPAQEIGGDFYDFFMVDDDRLGVVIADVSGKGVPAALFMAVTRTLLKSTALAGLGPGECLRRVNALLLAENASRMFVSVFYAILDTRTGALAFSNGGHDPPCVLRHGGAPEFLARTGDIVLGVLENSAYREGTATLLAGDALLLYTDGVTEAMDATGNEFTDRRLAAFVDQAPVNDPEPLIRSLIDAVKAFSGDAAQSDDITVLAVRYVGTRR
jgi:serine phosphatase RsbU (regulator of sigma subunit)